MYIILKASTYTKSCLLYIDVDFEKDLDLINQMKNKFNVVFRGTNHCPCSSYF